jgi:chorismate mutase-like protein
MDEIAGWRKKIDDIDARLLELLNERAQCAMGIGEIKMARGLKIHDQNREKTVLAHIAELNKGPLDNNSIQRIFKYIIEECRNIETASGK